MRFRLRSLLLLLLLFAFPVHLVAGGGGDIGGCQWWQCAGTTEGAECRTAFCGATCDPRFFYGAQCSVMHDGPGYWCNYYMCYDI
jgi:hypothetical protein